MMRFIYKITCLINNKVYIGQTNRLEWRWYQHIHSSQHLKHDSQVISRAIAIHGSHNFTFEPIAVIVNDDALEEYRLSNDLEAHYIGVFKSLIKEGGYNVRPGGDTVPVTDEIKAKISVGLNKFYANNVSIRKGVPFTDAHRAAISAGSMGKAGTNLGKEFSEEWKLNMSKAMPKDSKKRRRFSDKIEAEIVEKYKNGETTHKMYQDYKCSKSTIRTILLRLGVELRSNKDTHSSNRKVLEEDELEICRLYRTGNYTAKSIGDKYPAYGRTTIRDVLVRNKILKG